jgi:hypothetical protein
MSNCKVDYGQSTVIEEKKLKEIVAIRYSGFL